MRRPVPSLQSVGNFGRTRPRQRRRFPLSDQIRPGVRSAEARGNTRRGTISATTALLPQETVANFGWRVSSNRLPSGLAELS
jgi:hypothetical protein